MNTYASTDKNSIDRFQEDLLRILLSSDTNLTLLKQYLENTQVNEITMMSALDFQATGYDNTIKQWLSDTYLKPTSEVSKNQVEDKQQVEDNTQFNTLNEKIAKLEAEIVELKEKSLLEKNNIISTFVEKFLSKDYRCIDELLDLLDDANIEITIAMFTELTEDDDYIIMDMTFNNANTVWNAMCVYTGYMTKDVIYEFADRNKFTDYQKLAERYLDPKYFGEKSLKKITGVKQILEDKLPEFQFTKKYEVAKAKHMIAKYEAL